MIVIWAEDSSCEPSKQSNRVIRWTLVRISQDSGLELGQPVLNLKAEGGLKQLIIKLDPIYKADNETKQ